MAVKTVSVSGGLWSNPATWSPAGVPTTNDSIVLNATSGNLTIDQNTAIVNGIDFTGYPASRSITFNSGRVINVYGTINLGAPSTYGIIGTSGGLNIVGGAATITSNGVLFPLAFVISNVGSSLTLTDDLNVTNLTIGNATGIYTIDNYNINVFGNFKIGITAANTVVTGGSTVINIKGVCTWSQAGNSSSCGNNVNIDAGANIVTCTGPIGWGGVNGATLNYMSGTVYASTATLLFNRNFTITSTLNCTSAIVWGAVQLSAGQNTINFTGDLYCVNISMVALGLNTTTGKYIYVSGNCSTSTISGTPVGTSKIVMIGNGTLQTTGTLPFRIDIDINTTGTINIPGIFRYNAKTFRHINGTVNATGTLYIGAGLGSPTFDCSGMNWNNVEIYGAGTSVTNLSDLKILGNLYCQSTTIINGFTTYIGGGLTQGTSTLSGTSTIYFNGTGTITQSATAQLGTVGQSVIINTSGLITFGSIFRFQGSVLDIQSGPSTVDASTNNTSFTHTGTNNITLNCVSALWPAVNFGFSGIVTLNSNLRVTNFSVTNNYTINLNTIEIGGNFTLNNILAGSSALLLNGTGTWNNAATNSLKLSTNINTTGTITIAGLLTLGNMTLTHTSGTVITTGSTLRVGGAGSQPVTLNTKGSSDPNSSTLSTNGINWDNFIFDAANAVTLVSDLRVCGNVGMSTSVDTLNSSNGSKLYVKGSFIPSYNLGKTLYGSSEIVFDGQGSIFNNVNGTLAMTGLIVTISGVYTIAGISLFEIGTGTTLQVVGNGKLKGNLINLNGNCNVYNADKMEIRNIGIDNGRTITMNKFFSGKANRPVRVYSSDNAVPVPLSGNIVFTEAGEQISKFTKISRCNIIQKGRLLCLTPESNKGNNTGIRYVNQSPNGIPKNSPSIVNSQPYGLASVQDPSCTRTFLPAQA